MSHLEERNIHGTFSPLFNRDNLGWWVRNLVIQVLTSEASFQEALFNPLMSTYSVSVLMFLTISIWKRTGKSFDLRKSPAGKGRRPSLCMKAGSNSSH